MGAKDESLVQHVKTALATAMNDLDALQLRFVALRGELRYAQARVEDAEQRATTYEQRFNEAAEQASRTVALEEACEKLLEALTRLPTRMEDAGMKLSVVKPEIPLYGTHEWQAVVDAKFALLAAMRPKE